MRLFIATPLTEEIEETLARVIFDLKQKRGRVKWVNPKNIHLTLKFLGETDESKVEPIKNAIQEVASRYSKIKSIIDRVGVFPNLDRPRIIWVGLSEGIGKLKSIAADIENEMEKLGFEKERRSFKSHLTLGRVKDSSGLDELIDAIKNYKSTPEDIVFDRVILFKSTLTPAGPIYDKLFEAVLKQQ